MDSSNNNANFVEEMQRMFEEARQDDQGDGQEEEAEENNITESASIDIPTEVIKYFLRKTGCQSSERDFHRIVSFAASHFLTKVIDTAKVYKQFKNKTSKNNNPVAEQTLRMREVAKGLNSKNVPSIVPAFLN